MKPEEIVHRDQLPQLFTALGFQTGVEVGVFQGDYAEIITQHWKGRLHLVDAWSPVVTRCKHPCDHEDNYRQTLRRFAGNPQVIVIRNTSVKAAANFADAALHWVYIDADHYYDTVLADLNAWWPKVRPGGVIAGHDYVSHNSFQVKPAVDEFFGALGLTVHATRETWPSWFVFKPAA